MEFLYVREIRILIYGGQKGFIECAPFLYVSVKGRKPKIWQFDRYWIRNRG